jgi:hypothetical protein
MVQNRRRSVSIAISSIIIIVVSIIFTLLAVNWIFGVWRSEQSKFAVTPILLVKSTGETTVNNASLILKLHILNEGDVEVRIIRVEVEATKGFYVNSTRFVIPPGSSIDVVIEDWSWVGEGDPVPILPGNKYRIKLYTERFGVYIQDVIASG